MTTEFAHVTDFEEIWLLYSNGMLWGWGVGVRCGMVDDGNCTVSKEFLRTWWTSQAENGYKYGPRLEH